MATRTALRNAPASPAKPSAAQAAEETVTRYVGNCQICEHDQKLTVDMKMVHHGYRRPGHGTIEGDCPCVGADPYEVSCDRIKSYVKGLREALRVTNARRAEIAEGKVTYFEARNYHGWGQSKRWFTTSYSSFVTEWYNVGLYRSDDAGIESDPETPWATVCEEHGGVVCYETRKAAESYVAHPEQWCPVCQEKTGGPKTYPHGEPPLQEKSDPTP